MNEEVLFEIVVRKGPTCFPFAINVAMFLLLFFISTLECAKKYAGVIDFEDTTLIKKLLCIIGIGFSFIMVLCEKDQLILGLIFLLFFITYYSILYIMKGYGKYIIRNKHNKRTYKF